MLFRGNVRANLEIERCGSAKPESRHDYERSLNILRFDKNGESCDKTDREYW